MWWAPGGCLSHPFAGGPSLTAAQGLGDGASAVAGKQPPTLRRGHLWEHEHRAPRDGRCRTARQGGPGLGLLLLFV